MTKTGAAILGFIAGGIGGFIVGKVLTSKQADERLEMEIDSVKEAFRKARKTDNEYARKNETPKDDLVKDTEKRPERAYGDAPQDEETKKEQAAYRDVVRKTSYRPGMEKTEESLHRMADALKPKVISPEELGEEDDWGDPVSLTYFADGVLVDSNHMPMSEIDIQQSIGDINPAEHFGDHEEDSVHIANPRTKTYFEVLKDLRTYQQFLEQDRPHARG